MPGHWRSGDEEMQMRSRKALDETAKNLRAIIDDKDKNLQEAPRNHMTEHFQKFAKTLAMNTWSLISITQH